MTKTLKKLAAAFLTAAIIVSLMPALGAHTAYADDSSETISCVHATVKAPVCGTEVELVEYADGDGQYGGRTPHTHPWPAVTVSSDEAKLFYDPYHGGSEVTGVWTTDAEGNIGWETASGYFTGTMEGEKEYYARFELDAVNGYRFGSDRYDVIKVNGQKPVYVSNDSDTQVVVVAKVKASHVPASETIVKAAPDKNGSIDRTCEKCGNGYSEAIPAPKDFLLSKTSYTYSGAKNTPSVTVKDTDGNIVDPSNYDVTYKNNINAGTATATVTFKGDYFEGSKTLTFNITKAANPLTMKPKTASVKYSKLKKKTQTLAASKLISFTNNVKDKKSYTLVSAKRGSKTFKKYFKVNKTTGKVTIKKNKKMKKGTYKVKVKVKALGNSNYKASAVKTVTFKVKIK